MARPLRDQAKERCWRRVIQEWRRSGGSVRSFCAARGLSEPSFYAWRRVLCERDQAGDSTKKRSTRPSPKGQPQTDNIPPVFVPVHVVETTATTMTASAIEVVLGNGRVVRVSVGFDAATLQRLLAVLEESSC